MGKSSQPPGVAAPRSQASSSMSGRISVGPDGRPVIDTPNARFLKKDKDAPEPAAAPEAAAPEEAQPKRQRTDPNPLPAGPPPGYTGPLPLPDGWVEATDPRYDNATYCAHPQSPQPFFADRGDC